MRSALMLSSVARIPGWKGDEERARCLVVLLKPILFVSFVKFTNSRIFGASANFRNEQLEVDHTRYPEPFRFLFVGDDHSHGCGWKSYPPDYSFANCSSRDEGFRLGAVRAIRQSAGRKIVTVGSKRNPPDGPEDSSLHESWPGLTIDELGAKVGEWPAHQPDVVLIYAGTTDIVQLDSAATMAKRYELMLEKLHEALPTARVVVCTILDQGDPTATPEMRYNLQTFNRLLPGIVERRRKAMMEVFLADVARALPLLCAPGSGRVEAVGRVPLCSTSEVNPTGVGYAQVAASLQPALAQVFGLDGSCRGHPLCQDADVRLWRNQVDGGIRVVASYNS
jgi:hypothetical protein